MKETIHVLKYELQQEVATIVDKYMMENTDQPFYIELSNQNEEVIISFSEDSFDLVKAICLFVLFFMLYSAKTMSCCFIVPAL